MLILFIFKFYPIRSLNLFAAILFIIIHFLSYLFKVILLINQSLINPLTIRSIILFHFTPFISIISLILFSLDLVSTRNILIYLVVLLFKFLFIIHSILINLMLLIFLIQFYLIISLIIFPYSLTKYKIGFMIYFILINELILFFSFQFYPIKSLFNFLTFHLILTGLLVYLIIVSYLINLSLINLQLLFFLFQF